MGVAVVWNVITKYGLPIAAVLVCAFGLYHLGWVSRDADYQRYRIEVETRASIAKQDATRKALAYEAEIAHKSEALAKEAEEHEKIISSLSDKLKRSVARVRVVARCGSGQVPKSTATASASEHASGDPGGVDESGANFLRVVDRYEQINVALKACQGYVTAINAAPR